MNGGVARRATNPSRPTSSSGRGQRRVRVLVSAATAFSLYLSNSNPPPHLLPSAATQTECIGARVLPSSAMVAFLDLHVVLGRDGGER